MLLSSIKLVDFRQFYGEQVINFSTNDKKNITLIHAENGVGKTTILNAILWCFFEKLSSDFEAKEDLICHQSVDENKKACRVEVSFIHDEKDYVALRRFKLQQRGTELKLYAVNDGNYAEIPNSKAFINSILPSDMAEYFFFHGEGISNISKKGSGDKFRKAIRDILGFTFAETAIIDLKYIESKWTKSMGELGKGQRVVEDAIKEKGTLEGAVHTIEKNIGKLNAKIKELDDSIKKLDRQIRESGHDQAKSIQTQINQLEREKGTLLRLIKDENLKRQSLIQKYGWAIIGHELAQKTIDFIDEEDHKARIPSPYDEKFVKNIISKHECICGRELVEGSREYNLVLDLVEDANTAGIRDKIHKAKSVGEKILVLCTEFLGEAQSAEGKLNTYHKRVGQIEGDIEDLQKQLSEISQGSVDIIQDELLACKRARDKAVLELGSQSEKLKRVKARIVELDKIIDRAGGEDEKIARLRSAQKLTTALIERCQSRLEEFEQDAKNIVARDVNEILTDFSRKNYRVSLSDDFDFELVKDDGKKVAKSKGENLLLNLSFVSALIKLASDRVGASGDFLDSGSIAPFVIDAPFGELDETYKGATAMFLPERSQQLVLLLSSSHWKGTVETNIRDRVGAEYVLISHKKKVDEVSTKDKPIDELEICGKKFQLSLYDQERECTYIEEVKL